MLCTKVGTPLRNASFSVIVMITPQMTLASNKFRKCYVAGFSLVCFFFPCVRVDSLCCRRMFFSIIFIASLSISWTSNCRNPARWSINTGIIDYRAVHQKCFYTQSAPPHTTDGLREPLWTEAERAKDDWMLWNGTGCRCQRSLLRENSHLTRSFQCFCHLGTEGKRCHPGASCSTSPR